MTTRAEMQAANKTDEARYVALIGQLMKEEAEAFSKAGNCPFTEDDLMFAAYLRDRMAFDEAFLNVLRRGEVTCTLNRENFEDSTFLPGKEGNNDY